VDAGLDSVLARLATAVADHLAVDAPISEVLRDGARHVADTMRRQRCVCRQIHPRRSGSHQRVTACCPA
jgi:hypothetical protein